MVRPLCRSGLLTAGLLLLGWLAPSAADLSLLYSPYRSLGKTRDFADAVDVRVMLPLGYGRDRAAAPEMARRPGVVEARAYTRADGARLELAILPSLTGGYELALYSPTAPPRHADLTEAENQIKALAARARAVPETPELGYEMLQLGHIEADRALALLKALGYNTVEFSVSTRSQQYEQILEMVSGQGRALPLVIKASNASKTSLLQADPGEARRTATAARTTGIEGAPELGGSHLHSTTAGAPEERLLVVYDRNQPEDLEKLVNLVQSHIDVPAQQIVIEALVIEVNTSKLHDLGVQFSASQGSASGTVEPSASTGKTTGTFIFSRNAFTDFSAFSGMLEAMMETGDAEILSSPSVLVLNDRQARIQVGQQIPVSRTTATTAAISKGVEYFPIGIVLNLRPRIDREGSEVTMQIETIISSISPASAARLEASDSDISFSPIVDNRLVETYVRVADGTPFIIGGLLSTNEQSTRIGVPGLMMVPYLGRLFSRERVERERREVIVVITPHIVPQDTRSFSYLIPKDSDIFDRTDYQLFRNAYRVRDDEVWDLKFVRQSPILVNLVERVRQYVADDVMRQRQDPFRGLLAGDIPGEEVLVRRMLGDIVGKLGYAEEIDLDKVFFFEAGSGGALVDRALQDALGKALVTSGRGVLLTFEARATPSVERPFAYPAATVRDTVVPRGEDERAAFLRALNPVVGEDREPEAWTIVLADRKDVEHLRQALILKRLLELNSKLPLTLESFQPGLQVLFPSREDMAGRYHLIDGEVAQLFYETSSSQYYPAFERIFNREVRRVERILGGQE
ncbi:MAG: hypothetical protein ABIL09_17750 [Gemmatimonadota bacterium]